MRSRLPSSPCNLAAGHYAISLEYPSILLLLPIRSNKTTPSREEWKSCLSALSSLPSANTGTRSSSSSRYSPRYRPNFRSRGTLLRSIDSRPRESSKVVRAACLFSRSRFNTAMRRSRGGGRQTEEETNERERKGEEGGKRRRERERVKGSRRRCWVGNPGFLERS